jgi:hypothetical protein
VKTTLSDTIKGLWGQNAGVEVEVLRVAPNGRSCLVQMPKPAPLHGGEKCWIPVSYLAHGLSAPRKAPESFSLSEVDTAVEKVRRAWYNRPGADQPSLGYSVRAIAMRVLDHLKDELDMP